MLEIVDVHRRYGDVIALDGLAFTVAPGEVCGFLGPNGAGKTTAMRIVMGVGRADRGEVRWHGRRVGPADRLRFGYLPEERGLYPRMKVAEHLVYLGRLHGLAATEAGDRAARWLSRLGLADRADDRVETLSLGNQQRVQLAAALVHEPELLVLDEPFSGLDPIGVDLMGEVLADLAAGGAAIVFSSHQLDLVQRFCRSVAIVDRGRVVLAGDVGELRSRGPRRLLVGVRGAAAGWATRVAGVAAVTEQGEDGHVTVELEPGTDEQALLAAARAAGAVEHFSVERPTLSQLFRQAVKR